MHLHRIVWLPLLIFMCETYGLPLLMYQCGNVLYRLFALIQCEALVAYIDVPV